MDVADGDEQRYGGSRRSSGGPTRPGLGLLVAPAVGIALVLIVALAVILVGGESEDDEVTGAAPSTMEPQPADTAAPETEFEDTVPEPTEPALSCTPEEPPAAAAADEPVIEPPAAEPRPTEVVIEDVVVGDGPTATEGDQVAVQYQGLLLADGSEFDTSWDDLTPLPFSVGTGSVIPGFDEGVLGMNVGGRRIVTIPAADGYGDVDQGPIPADSDLVFVVDLVQVCTPV